MWLFLTPLSTLEYKIAYFCVINLSIESELSYVMSLVIALIYSAICLCLISVLMSLPICLRFQWRRHYGLLFSCLSISLNKSVYRSECICRLLRTPTVVNLQQPVWLPMTLVAIGVSNILCYNSTYFSCHHLRQGYWHRAQQKSQSAPTREFSLRFFMLMPDLNLPTVFIFVIIIRIMTRRASIKEGTSLH